MEFTVNALLLASCIVTNYNIKGIYEVSWNVEQVHKNSGFRKTMAYFDNEVHMQKNIELGQCNCLHRSYSENFACH